MSLFNSFCKGLALLMGIALFCAIPWGAILVAGATFVALTTGMGTASAVMAEAEKASAAAEAARVARRKNRRRR